VFLHEITPNFNIVIHEGKNMTFEEAKNVLAAHNQEHVLKGFDALTADQQKGLLKQISELDWDVIAMAKNHEKMETGELAPLPALTVSEIEAKKDSFKKTGLEAIRAGKVAACLLAGGMGTRLGLDRPKGELNIGLTHELFLFEQQMKNLEDVAAEADEASDGHYEAGKTKVTIPLYIMTSEKNDEDTRAFFKEHDYFGYPEEFVHFFVQEMAAAVDYDGKLLMEGPGRLATSPNGNGGWFSSLAKAGYLDDLHKQGIEWINIYAVDNPLQRMCTPEFVGATIQSGAESGSKVIAKNDPHEKMGVVCRENGHPSVIEYYEMTEDMAQERNADGSLTYGMGVILNYIFKVEKLEKIMRDRLPVHVVEKKIPYMKEDGTIVKPETPNGYKFETLVVDMIRLMNDTVPYEVVREKEFAPIKNLHGVDSLDSSRELMKGCGIEL
jgi:UDP-N-acetylglucosamine/UDP-N-acetylgalactosamine diphosphorylase